MDKEEKQPSKAGRPHRNFDRKTFESLCEIQCTKSEIESVFWTDQRTVDLWVQREYGEDFSTIYKRYSEDGKASLRRLQLKHAQKNPTMAIFLGKVILGQRDNTENPNAGKEAYAQGVDKMCDKLSEIQSAIQSKNDQQKAD